MKRIKLRDIIQPLLLQHRDENSIKLYPTVGIGSIYKIKTGDFISNVRIVSNQNANTTNPDNNYKYGIIRSLGGNLTVKITHQVGNDIFINVAIGKIGSIVYCKITSKISGVSCRIDFDSWSSPIVPELITEQIDTSGFTTF